MQVTILRVVRGLLNLAPHGLKMRLRKYTNLRQWYSSQLRSSSLAYEVPSLKKTRLLWSQTLFHQEQSLSQIKIDSNRKIIVQIIGFSPLLNTLNSLRMVGTLVKTVFVDSRADICLSQFPDLTIERYDYAKEIAERFIDSPVLMLEAGSSLESESASRLLLSIRDSSICYFDKISVDESGRLTQYYFLPDWNPDLLISSGYISGALYLPSTNLLKFFESDDDVGSFLLRLLLKDEQLTINHKPFVLTRSSTFIANSAQKRSNILLEKNISSTSFSQVCQVTWPLLGKPMISLLIPTYNGLKLVKACIESILDKTTYQNYEILLIDNNSDDPECLAYFDELDKHPKVRLLKYPHPFNYSAINNFAVKHANGEVVGLVNNDIEVISPRWLEYMAGHAMRDDIGCVGAKLLYSDDRIQHAGVVLGYGGGAGHAHKYFPRYHPGYMNRLIATQNYSAVTAACLLVKKSKYEEVGGLNEKDLHVAFNDVDFCLKVLETGVRNIYCAEAELYHHESVSRGLDISEEKAARFNRELTYLRTKWKKYIDHDPAYNPNLTLKRENFAIKGKEEY